MKTGLDRCIAWLTGASVEREDREVADLIRKGRLGLVTNPSAVTADLVSAPDALRGAGAHLASLFGPEHGVRGEFADGTKVGNSTDRRTGLPLWSLYGEVSRPTPEMLKGLDAILFDIQDVGARFYTFTSTLSHVMGAACEQKLPVIVLDRPNPIGGVTLEGPILEPDHSSFVGLHPIPIRHGATMGELGQLWAEFGAGTAPQVVRCSGWKRRSYWKDTGLQWISPSPNVPTPETALVYPGTCLLEGTNVSEARGTTAPFRWFGAPWVDPEKLTDQLNAEGLPGVRFRPVRFIPSASKHKDVPCGGCQIHVTDWSEFRAVITGYAVLAALRKGYPDQFAWRQGGGRFAVDRLAGTSTLRQAVDAGTSWREMAQQWEPGLAKHKALLEKVALY